MIVVLTANRIILHGFYVCRFFTAFGWWWWWRWWGCWVIFSGMCYYCLFVCVWCPNVVVVKHAFKSKFMTFYKYINTHWWCDKFFRVACQTDCLFFQWFNLLGGWNDNTIETFNYVSQIKLFVFVLSNKKFSKN